MATLDQYYDFFNKTYGKEQADAFMGALRTGDRNALNAWRNPLQDGQRDAQGNAIDARMEKAGLGNTGHIYDQWVALKGQLEQNEMAKKEAAAKGQIDDALSFAKTQAQLRNRREDAYYKNAQEAYGNNLAARNQMLRQARQMQNAPLVSERMMQQGTDQAARNALALAKSGGRAGPSMAVATNRNAEMGTQAAQQGSIMGMQEQQGRQQMLLNALQAARQGDLASAQMSQASSLGQSAQGLQAGTMGLTPGMQQQAMQQQMAHNIDMQQMQFENQKELGTEGKLLDMIPSLINGTTQAVGSIVGGVAKSDERVKKNIHKEDARVDDFLRQLVPSSFEYKRPEQGVYAAPAGTNLGVMAQDVERSQIGREMVMDTPEGKVIDKYKMLAASLASNARLNERLDKLVSMFGEGRIIEPKVTFGEGRIIEPKVTFGDIQMEQAKAKDDLLAEMLGTGKGRGAMRNYLKGGK